MRRAIPIGRFFAFVAAFSVLAHCNTEIVSLLEPASSEIPISVSATWPVLSTRSGTNSKRLEIYPTHSSQKTENSDITVSPDELWVRLEIDDWKTWNKHSPSFTLRLSWPASMPADFSISVFRPPAVSSKADNVQYARIRAISTGRRSYRSGNLDKPEVVKFDIVIEPLILRVVPRGTVPILGFLVATITFASCIIPHVTAFLSEIADKATEEATGKKDR